MGTERTSDRDLFDRGVTLMNAGKAAEAVDAFKLAMEHGQHESAACMLIALLYFHRLNDAKRALPFAQQAVRFAPRSETASLCYVHCLFRNGRQEELQSEIRRYIATGGKIDLYTTLFEENDLQVSDFM